MFGFFVWILWRRWNLMARYDTIDFINATTTSGNATDVGNLVSTSQYLAGSQGETKGWFIGGYNNGGANIDVICYIDLETQIQNATDRGNLSRSIRQLSASEGATYTYVFGGYDSAQRDYIDYFDHSLATGNAADKGDLTVARSNTGGV
jgi:hypothetical protein